MLELSSLHLGGACVPLAGPTGPPMGVYMVPPIGAGVWVEFEHGDPDKPVWIGCRWGSSNDVPSQAQEGLPVSPSIILQTIGQNSIVICDLPGPTFDITLTCVIFIAITAEGVTILAEVEVTAAQIKLTGITDINDGAEAVDARDGSQGMPGFILHLGATVNARMSAPQCRSRPILRQRVLPADRRRWRTPAVSPAATSPR